MKFLERYVGRSAADLRTALEAARAAAAEAKAEVDAHAAEEMAAAADGENALRTWSQKHQKLQDTLRTRQKLIQPLEIALQEQERKETVAANRARVEAQEKKSAALAARAPALEAKMREIAAELAAFKQDEEDCRALAAEKLPGVERVLCAAARLPEDPTKGWHCFWQLAELPSLRRPHSFYWSGRHHHGPGDMFAAA
ncbi:MAG: hypothetical protein AB7E79_09615 [Rhodospirillaceae bacterium]